MDEGTGTSLSDSSTNNYSMQFNGMNISEAWVTGKFGTGIALNGNSQQVSHAQGVELFKSSLQKILPLPCGSKHRNPITVASGQALLQLLDITAYLL